MEPLVKPRRDFLSPQWLVLEVGAHRAGVRRLAFQAQVDPVRVSISSCPPSSIFRPSHLPPEAGEGRGAKNAARFIHCVSRVHEEGASFPGGFLRVLR